MRFSSLLAVTTALSAIAVQASASEPAKKWQPTVELEGRTNSDRSILYPKLLIPLAQNENSMLFTDLRMRADDNSSEEYNVGLGYRQIHNGLIFGAYGFVDHLSSATGNNYWQGTAGLELLSEDWDFRLNGYLPESTKNVLTPGTPAGLVIDSGGNFGLSSGGGLRERAMPGVDGEIGYRLPIDMVDMRLFGGFYHFSADGFEDVSGPKARAELTVKHEHWNTLPEGVELTVGAQFQNDGPREDTTTALAQIRIPLGGGGSSTANLSRLERRMTNFIERDVDIVAGAGKGPATVEAASVAINGVDYTKVATVDANTADVNAAVAGAGTNALVLFDGSKGTILTNSTIQALDGQALVSGGLTVTATGLHSNTVLNTALDGTRATISNSSAYTGGLFDVLLNFDGVGGSLTGIDLAGDNFTGGGVKVENQTIGQQVSVKDVAISGANSAGVWVQNTAGSVTLDGISSQGLEYGAFIAHAENVTLSNATFEGGTIGVAALMNAHGLQLSNVSTANTQASGVMIQDSDNVIADGISITNTGDHGFYAARADNLTISNVTVDHADDYGFILSDVNHATVSGVEVTNTLNAVSFQMADDIQVSDLHIENATSSAIFFFDATNVTGSATTANSVGCSISGMNTGSAIAINGVVGLCPF